MYTGSCRELPETVKDCRRRRILGSCGREADRMTAADSPERGRKGQKMDRILYGAAYYDEYMPYDRLDTDIAMMKKAGLNVIRIAESTWSSEEPQEGVFDFSHVTRVLDACEKAGISVIVGTPTYAIPAWMAKAYPEVMVTDRSGKRPYGARQIMDITHPAYRFFAERIIRKLMEAVQGYSCVIGFQLDNETKHFGTCSENVQQMFVRHMRERYHGDLERLNRDFGLNYWSNRINSWEEFPSVVGTINGSLGCAFEAFQRQQVTDFLLRQSEIVREYCRPDQFITHNFDFAWKGHSFGVQPDVDHFQAAQALTVAGCDIYHPSQDKLTGKEIAFCGSLTRSLKKDNYLVIETEAQGFPEWTPYEGQLRLQAFSHLAYGADSVMYWHWHSIHNACETYWKGILSHDFAENAVYREVCRIGAEFSRLSPHLLHQKKENKAAILVSNPSLTALKWFPFPAGAEGGMDYNDVVRWIFDALYESNIGCDFVSPEETDLARYDVLFVPALYSAPESCLTRIRDFAAQGGTVVATFKTAFTDENVKVWTDEQPHLLKDCFGVLYHEFTAPVDVFLKENRDGGQSRNSACGLSTEAACGLSAEDRRAHLFMELLEPQGAQVLASYDHYAWKKYAAVTRNDYGKGTCIYLGCMTSPAYLKALIKALWQEKGLSDWKQDYAFPLVITEGTNQAGKRLTWYLNYAKEPKRCICPQGGTELLSGETYAPGQEIVVGGWDLRIVEE